MDRLDRSKYEIFNVIKNAAKFDRKIPEVDIDDRIREYYRAWNNRVIEYKTFYFTDKTVRRTENIDYSSLEPEDFVSIHGSGIEKGVVVTSGSNSLLNFGYVLTPQHIIIGVYRGALDASSIVVWDNNHLDGSGFDSRWIGNIIVAPSGVTFNPNSVMTIAERVIRGDHYILHHTGPGLLKRLNRIIVEMQRSGHVGSNVKISDYTERELETMPTLKAELVSFSARHEMLEKAFRMFLFLKTASIIEQTYISEQAICTYRRIQGEKRGYILVDSSWDGDVTVLNPFAVRGHFRRQPKKNKNGEWYRELIYIDSFMKKGYHRRAQRIIEEER